MVNNTAKRINYWHCQWDYRTKFVLDHTRYCFKPIQILNSQRLHSLSSTSTKYYVESNKTYEQCSPNNKSPNSQLTFLTFSFALAILFSFTNIIPLTLCDIKPINNETIDGGLFVRKRAKLTTGDVSIHCDCTASKTIENNHLLNDSTDIHGDSTRKQSYVTKYLTNLAIVTHYLSANSSYTIGLMTAISITVRFNTRIKSSKFAANTTNTDKNLIVKTITTISQRKGVTTTANSSIKVAKLNEVIWYCCVGVVCCFYFVCVVVFFHQKSGLNKKTKEERVVRMRNIGIVILYDQIYQRILDTRRHLW